MQGTREQARRTQQDRERVAMQKQHAPARDSSLSKRKLDEFVKDAIKRGLLKKKKKMLSEAKKVTS